MRQFRFRAPAPLPVEKGAAVVQWAPASAQSVSPIGILIADDHEMFRAGLRMVLENPTWGEERIAAELSEVDDDLGAFRLKVLRTPVQAPKANAYCEAIQTVMAGGSR